MATQITANLPALNFPKEVDYPTQEDWAAFSAAAELNFGILGNGWSTQMQLWKTQANAMSIELNNNADLAQSIANYQGDWVSQGYTLGQSVSVSGVYYICKLTHITGQNPTSGGSLYWNLALGNWYGNFGTGTQSFNGFGGSGFKNYIINGNFDIWQRGTSQTNTGYGSDDRWVNDNNISTKTHSLVNATDTERALFNSSKFSRTVCVTGGTETSLTTKLTKIEDVTKLAGKTVTLSFWAKADSNRNIAIEFQQAFGTGGSPSALYTNGGQLVALTSTWQKKSITITLPSLVGKTLGTDGVHTSFTKISFWFEAGSNWSPTYIPTLGTQSGTFDMAQVQLEEGSVATPFENRPYGLELSLCQYYTRPISCAIQDQVTTTVGQNTVQNLYFPTMRTVPTVTNLSATYTGSINSSNVAAIFNNRIQYEFYYVALNALGSAVRYDLLTSEL